MIGRRCIVYFFDYDMMKLNIGGARGVVYEGAFGSREEMALSQSGCHSFICCTLSESR